MWAHKPHTKRQNMLSKPSNNYTSGTRYSNDSTRYSDTKSGTNTSSSSGKESNSNSNSNSGTSRESNSKESKTRTVR